MLKEFADVIQKADSILETDQIELYLKLQKIYSGNHSGMYMRYISNTNSPSNHSLGAAVDFRVPQNPMYTSRNKKHTEFIKYVTGKDMLKPKTAKVVTLAHEVFMEKFHGKNYRTKLKNHDEILDKYRYINNFKEVDITLLEKISDNNIIIPNLSNITNNIQEVLKNHNSTIVFKESAKEGIDKLIQQVKKAKGDTIFKVVDNDIQAYFDERNAFLKALKEIGFKDLDGFCDYFQKVKPYNNLLFEHGFCDNGFEVYEAFNKAHKIVSKKLIGRELNIEWGGIYNSLIDGMHFSLNKELILELTKNISDENNIHDN